MKFDYIIEDLCELDICDLFQVILELKAELSDDTRVTIALHGDTEHGDIMSVRVTPLSQTEAANVPRLPNKLCGFDSPDFVIQEVLEHISVLEKA